MPYLWSHILFGREALSEAGFSEPKHWGPFELGCQGPDVLLYHNFWPWKRNDAVKRLGFAIHRNHCGPFLVDLIQAVGEHPGMRSYVAGFLTHHVLDRNTHPYIHYWAGYRRYKHQKLEVIIDTLLAERMEGIQTWKTPAFTRIDVGESLPRQWVEVLAGIAQQHFPQETEMVLPTHWNQAYQDMKRALRLFHDPLGIKWLLTFGKIGPFRYRPIRTDTDYLNESGREWSHPAIPGEKHRESFLDLWATALDEAALLLQQADSYWKGTLPLSTLEQTIGNISYDTGKACDANLTNHLAEPLV